MFVRSKNNNKLVSVSNLVSYEEEGQSPFLARYNRQKAVTISARLVGDYSLDEALNFLDSLRPNLQKYSDEDGHTIARTGFVLKESTTK